MSAVGNASQHNLCGVGVAGCIISWEETSVEHVSGLVRWSRIEGSARDQPVLMRPRRVEAMRVGNNSGWVPSDGSPRRCHVGSVGSWRFRALDGNGALQRWWGRVSPRDRLGASTSRCAIMM
jgi:hypothetical protein